VPVQQVMGGEVVKLASERKHLTNLFKMVAYRTAGRPGWCARPARRSRRWPGSYRG